MIQTAKQSQKILFAWSRDNILASHGKLVSKIQAWSFSAESFEIFFVFYVNEEAVFGPKEALKFPKNV